MNESGTLTAKSYSAFTINNGLLQKVCAAVKAGEQKAKSAGEVQSFEVFVNGWRQHLVIGRLMIVPPAVCDSFDKFPIALLHGTVLKEFTPESVSDILMHKIGEGYDDSYSQGDLTTIKEKVFKGQRGYDCLVVFVPAWASPREYVVFRYTKDEAALEALVRHEVFSAYYDPRLSSGYDALLTDAQATDSVDVTDITPKLPFPELSESPFKRFPEMQLDSDPKTEKDPDFPNVTAIKKASARLPYACFDYKVAAEIEKAKEEGNPPSDPEFEDAEMQVMNIVESVFEDEKKARKKKALYVNPKCTCGHWQSIHDTLGRPRCLMQDCPCMNFTPDEDQDDFTKQLMERDLAGKEKPVKVSKKASFEAEFDSIWDDVKKSISKTAMWIPNDPEVVKHVSRGDLENIVNSGDARRIHDALIVPYDAAQELLRRDRESGARSKYSADHEKTDIAKGVGSAMLDLGAGVLNMIVGSLNTGVNTINTTPNEDKEKEQQGTKPGQVTNTPSSLPKSDAIPTAPNQAYQNKLEENGERIEKQYEPQANPPKTSSLNLNDMQVLNEEAEDNQPQKVAARLKKWGTNPDMKAVEAKIESLEKYLQSDKQEPDGVYEHTVEGVTFARKDYLQHDINKAVEDIQSYVSSSPIIENALKDLRSASPKKPSRLFMHSKEEVLEDINEQVEELAQEIVGFNDDRDEAAQKFISGARRSVKMIDSGVSPYQVQSFVPFAEDDHDHDIYDLFSHHEIKAFFEPISGALESVVDKEKAAQDDESEKDESDSKTSSKKAAVNFFAPGQVLREFYPEIQHEIVDTPNYENSPMVDVDLPESTNTWVSTAPAAIGVGMDGKPQVLDGAPLRQELDIRGPMFTDEFYSQYSGVPGSYLASFKAARVAAGDKEEAKKHVSQALKLLMGEVAATFIAAFKATSRPILQSIPGKGVLKVNGGLQGDTTLTGLYFENENMLSAAFSELNSNDLREAINNASAQASVWSGAEDGGFLYEVFVRAESVDTDKGTVTYRFITGSKGV